MGFIPSFFFSALKSDKHLMRRRNVAFTLHLGHATGDMKRRESNVGDEGQGGQRGWAFATYIFGGVKCRSKC